MKGQTGTLAYAWYTVFTSGCAAPVETGGVHPYQAEMESDIALARHVTYVHQHKKNPELDFEPFDPKFLKVYISQVMLSLLPAVSREQLYHNLPQGFDLRHPLPRRYEVPRGCMCSQPRAPQRRGFGSQGG